MAPCWAQYLQRRVDAVALVGVQPALGAAAVQLQAQAFGQVARTHAGRLQRLQQLQPQAEAVHQFFHLLQVVVHIGQGGGELGQRIFQVAVVVERLDQKAQHRHVLGRQAQRQRLAVQVLGQRGLRVRTIAGIQLVVAVGGGHARRRLATPFAVVGRHIQAAIAVPAVGLGACSLEVGIGRAGLRGSLADSITLADPGVGARQAELLARRGLVVALQERVVVEHLLDFALQLQRRQLQQADRLLQLRREGQVLRDAKGQPGFHGFKCRMAAEQAVTANAVGEPAPRTGLVPLAQRSGKACPGLDPGAHRRLEGCLTA